MIRTQKTALKVMIKSNLRTAKMAKWLPPALGGRSDADQKEMDERAPASQDYAMLIAAVRTTCQCLGCIECARVPPSVDRNVIKRTPKGNRVTGTVFWDNGMCDMGCVQLDGDYPFAVRAVETCAETYGPFQCGYCQTFVKEMHGCVNMEDKMRDSLKAFDVDGKEHIIDSVRWGIVVVSTKPFCNPARVYKMCIRDVVIVPIVSRPFG